MNSGFVVMTRSVFLCACTRDVAVERLCDSGMLGGLGAGKLKGNKKALLVTSGTFEFYE